MNTDKEGDSISHEAAKPQSVDDVIVALFFVPWCLCVSSFLLNRRRKPDTSPSVFIWTLAFDS